MQKCILRPCFYFTSLFLVFLMLLSAPSSHAYQTILEAGEPLDTKEYHLGFAPQFYTGDFSGTNGVFYLRKGLSTGRDVSIQLGTGGVDFFTTLSTRWIPIPDLANQPALGLRFDVTLSRDESLSSGVFRIAPFASKQFSTSSGVIEPYAYLPLGMRVVEGSYNSTSQLVFGSKVKVEELLPAYFYAEMGLNMKNSLSYFSIGLFSTFTD